MAARKFLTVLLVCLALAGAGEWAWGRLIPRVPAANCRRSTPYRDCKRQWVALVVGGRVLWCACLPALPPAHRRTLPPDVCLQPRPVARATTGPSPSRRCPRPWPSCVSVGADGWFVPPRWQLLPRARLRYAPGGPCLARFIKPLGTPWLAAWCSHYTAALLPPASCSGGGEEPGAMLHACLRCGMQAGGSSTWAPADQQLPVPC